MFVNIVYFMTIRSRLWLRLSQFKFLNCVKFLRQDLTSSGFDNPNKAFPIDNINPSMDNKRPIVDNGKPTTDELTTDS